jgi:serine/threonine-protein kinase
MDNFQTLQNEIVPFLRRRDYLLIRELGQGACGKTVLLYDETIDEQFVCKKYLPYSEIAREGLFANFLREIKLLHNVHHPNLVRIFNYYLYPEKFAGYILMEFVDGVEIDRFANENPHKLDRLFEQAIEGFSHLGTCGILHRDIRMGNLMVDRTEQLKIIDLGFGKKITTPADYEKSITLNWWCKTPAEFVEKRYDYGTEVYFVGKLFEKLIQDNDIENFRYKDILRRMCSVEPNQRFPRFSDIQQELRNESFTNSDFSEESKLVYRKFAHALLLQIRKIESKAGYVQDMSKVLQKLDDAYRSVMLEEYAPAQSSIVSSFVNGSYYRRDNNPMLVTCFKDFLNVLKGAGPDFQKIILANLHTRLNAVERYSQETEEIPF